MQAARGAAFGWILAAICSPWTEATAAEPARAHGAGALYEGQVGEDLSRIEAAWQRVGKVSTLPPRLLLRGASVDLALPAEATDESNATCVTLLGLSSTNAVFSLRFGQDESETRRDFPVASTRGLAELTRCGPRKAALAEVTIEAQSPRAVVSFLVLVGDAPAPSGLDLVGRQAGPAASGPTLGPRPRTAPLAERLAIKRRTRSLEEPTGLSAADLEADDAGVARTTLSARAGCHTFDILDASSDPGLADVDARVLDAHGATLAVDGSTAPDASLSVCLGEPETVTLDVRGAPAGGVVWLHANWPLPDGVPPEWGPRARARLADTLHRERWPTVSSRPIAASLGVQGTTRVAVSARPGACYLAAVAALDRQPERLGLAMQAGGRVSQARARPDRASASVTLCATGTELGAEVQSVGAGASWILGVWEIEGPSP